MRVYDMEPSNGGTSGTGTINLFAIGNTNSTQTPLQTINGDTVTLTLSASLISPTLEVSPTSGPASGDIALVGKGFAGNSVNISYLNPATSTWIPIVDNLAISSENFSYATKAPDLLQNNPAGDHTAANDTIVFRATDNINDNTYDTAVPYMEWRRGLTQISNQTTTGIWGNNTNLATTVFVQNTQPITLAGKWFTPGNAELLWDYTINLGSVTVDETGFFNTTLQVPQTTAGNHSITINDGAVFCVNITRLPTVSDNYTSGWHTSDFTVNLTPDFPVTETYYKINNGSNCMVSADGQPQISIEGSDGTLEYWSTWSVYGTSSMQIGNVTITGIQLDKTAPQTAMEINQGAATTGFTAVNLTVSASDSVSGVNQMRLSNDGTWGDVSWEPYISSTSWHLTSGNGVKTVYCQVKDNAGLIANTTASIVLNTRQTTTAASTTTSSSSPNPTEPATPQPSPTPQVPELNIQTLLALLAVMATLFAAVKYTAKKRR
jgi:hypothetical protein